MKWMTFVCLAVIAACAGGPQIGYESAPDALAPSPPDASTRMYAVVSNVTVLVCRVRRNSFEYPCHPERGERSALVSMQQS